MSKKQVHFYLENGYLLVENLFDANEILKASESINEIISTNAVEKIGELEPKDDKVIRRIWAPTKRCSVLKDMAESGKILDIVEEIIGKNIAFHYSKLNMKGPKVGSIVEWHQDFSYYPHTNTDLLS